MIKMPLFASVDSCHQGARIYEGEVPTWQARIGVNKVLYNAMQERDGGVGRIPPRKPTKPIRR